MRKTEVFSRIVVVLFYIGNMLLVNLFRILYRMYCIKKIEQIPENYEEIVGLKSLTSEGDDPIKHVYIIGAKSIGQYKIKYHVACKSNGDGYMNLEKLPGAVMII